MSLSSIPAPQGLYDSRHEHDAGGVGFIADLKARKSHKIVQDALTILVNLEHRGACGAEKNTGDGAGILGQMPDRVLRQICPSLGISLPELGAYAVGLVYLPTDDEKRAAAQELFRQTVEAEGQRLLGWREVPHDASSLGKSARDAQPNIQMVFVGKGDLTNAPNPDGLAFERKLFVIRRQVEKALGETIYIPSLSSRTLVYKGMFTPPQLGAFYLDLADHAFESALALVHSRFSTNTFPSWPRAQRRD
jgi:glutamate synthase domain-containing protein 1